MKKSKKKGFTLIELMIVLAIIAILAVVLIPKAGAMKNSARDAGVETNVSNVRAILETKVSDDNYLANAANVTTLLTNNFGSAGSSPMSNPYTKGNGILNAGTATLTSVTADDTTNSIRIFDRGTTSIASLATITANKYVKGIVAVYVCSDGFVAVGVDGNGSVINQQTIK